MPTNDTRQVEMFPGLGDVPSSGAPKESNNSAAAIAEAEGKRDRPPEVTDSGPLPNPFAALEDWKPPTSSPPTTPAAARPGAWAYDVIAASEGRSPWTQRAPAQITSVRLELDPARVESLSVALRAAKELITDLRARIVRADAVAYVWQSTSEPGERGEVKRQCAEVMRRCFAIDDAQAFQAAYEQLEGELDAGRRLDKRYRMRDTK